MKHHSYSNRGDKAQNRRSDNLYRSCTYAQNAFCTYTEPLAHSSADWYQDKQMKEIDAVARLRHRK